MAIAGDLLRFVKGNWLRGPDKKPVDANLRLLCNMVEIWTGWVRFFAGQIVESRISRLIDCQPALSREELGHLDKNLWETDPSGTPLDPWSITDRMIMRDIATGELLTFSTSSKGGRKTLARLCQEFDHAYAYQDGRYPVVTLETYIYDHSNYGSIQNPRFRIVDWAWWEDSSESNRQTAAPGPVKTPSTAAVLEDAIPGWDDGPQF